jgi:hypothetical protein
MTYSTRKIPPAARSMMLVLSTQLSLLAGGQTSPDYAYPGPLCPPLPSNQSNLPYPSYLSYLSYLIS